MENFKGNAVQKYLLNFLYVYVIIWIDKLTLREDYYMDFKLLPTTPNDMAQFKSDMQEAFQNGAAKEFGNINVEILPEKDIDESLSKKGSVAYKALIDGKMLGGAIVVIDNTTQHNHLDFLYVRYGTQSKGVGQKIWNEIEKLYPETRVWETYTPYFEKRNIHFYIKATPHN